MKISVLLLLSLMTMLLSVAQESALPYYEIPDAPDDYGPGNVLSRMIDGLGYRYYWATEGLRPEDLAYRPSADGRSTDETINHILGLSNTILCGTQNVPVTSSPDGEQSFEEKRRQTLENLAEASRLLRGMKKKEVAKLQMIFERGDNRTVFPYWNMINGPIADAIYHTGQIVTFRRSAGNPMPEGVSVLTGKTRK